MGFQEYFRGQLGAFLLKNFGVTFFFGKTTYSRAHFHEKTFCYNLFRVESFVDLTRSLGLMDRRSDRPTDGRTDPLKTIICQVRTSH